MLIAFIDESGKPTKKEDTPFVLAALILKDDQLWKVRSDVLSIKSSLGVDVAAEIHAKSIVHGKDYYHTFSMDKRKALLDQLFDYLSTLDCTVISVVVRKTGLASMPDREAREYVENTAYTLLVERLAIFLSKHPLEHMLLVIDETDFKHDRSIRRRIELEIKHGFYTSRRPSVERFFKVPLFYPSKESIPLQLADLIAYTVFKKFSKPVSAIFDFNKYFELIKSKFDKCRDGRIDGCGLKVWG